VKCRAIEVQLQMLVFGTRWRCVVSITHRSLEPVETAHGTQWIQGWVGHSWSGSQRRGVTRIEARPSNPYLYWLRFSGSMIMIMIMIMIIMFWTGISGQVCVSKSVVRSYEQASDANGLRIGLNHPRPIL
jgi:hypothetical protein